MHHAHDLSGDEFKKWNEEMAHAYDPDTYHESSNRIVSWVERRRVKTLLSMLKAGPEHSVLEVGVGAGNILARVRAKSRAGIDLSGFLLTKARLRLHPEDVLIEGDAEKLTDHFPPASFDRVFCSEVLEHVQHPDRVLGQMARVVKPDGIVVVSVPNERTINRIKNILKSLGVFRLLFPHMADHMEDEWHVHVFDEALLRGLAEKDFTVKRMAYVPSPLLPIRLVAELSVRAPGS